jgi:hypothetical protein
MPVLTSEMQEKLVDDLPEGLKASHEVVVCLENSRKILRKF